MTDRNSVKASQYERVVWTDGAGWIAVERGTNLHALKEAAKGEPGDAWSIRCVKHGTMSCFYGCARCAREELAQ